MTWEYLFQEAWINAGPFDSRALLGSINTEANKLGTDGWELVSVADSGTFFRLFFKRPKPEPESWSWEVIE